MEKVVGISDYGLMEFPMIDGPSDSPGDAEFFWWETYLGDILGAYFGFAMSSKKTNGSADELLRIHRKASRNQWFLFRPKKTMDKNGCSPLMSFFCLCVPMVDDVLRCFEIESPFGNLEL